MEGRLVERSPLRCGGRGTWQGGDVNQTSCAGFAVIGNHPAYNAVQWTFGSTIVTTYQLAIPEGTVRSVVSTRGGNFWTLRERPVGGSNLAYFNPTTRRSQHLFGPSLNSGASDPSNETFWVNGRFVDASGQTNWVSNLDMATGRGWEWRWGGTFLLPYFEGNNI